MNTAEKKVNVGMIVAIVGPKRAIGKGPDLLVRISDDMKRFKGITMGHPIIMGRKTYESIGRPLPGRTNIVITRNLEYKPEGVVVCPDLEDALRKATEIELQNPSDKKEIIIMGGGEIYKQGLPFTDKLYLTLVESDAEGDVFFPDYSEFNKVTFKEDRFDEKMGLKYSWIDLER